MSAKSPVSVIRDFRFYHVVDGDTYDVLYPLSTDLFRKDRVRVLDCDAPERYSAEHKALLPKILELVTRQQYPDLKHIELNFPYSMLTYGDKRDKYGRLLARLNIGDIDMAWFIIENGGTLWTREKRIRELGLHNVSHRQE